MKEDHFKVLLRIEPSVVELTKEDYEKRMGIKPEGPKAKKAKDVRKPVVKDPKKKDDTPVPVSRAEAIKTLRERGHEYNDLKSKKRDELNKML